MNIQTRKIEFIKAFLQLQSEEVILRLENLLKSEMKAGIERMSIEELNNRIDLSMEDSKNDRIISSDDLLKEIEGWR